MNKEELNNLLDTIYELEGLVHLAITRDDQPFKLPELIVRKGREICRLAEEVAAPGKQTVNAPAAPAAPVAPAHAHVATAPAPAAPVAPAPAHVAPASAAPVAPAPAHVAPAPAPVAPAPAPAASPSNPQPRGKLVFSINDRYKFKRELFGGSDTAFNATLSLVASMDSYDEAEEYFIDELQWDQSRLEVIEFLDILKNYFN